MKRCLLFIVWLLLYVPTPAQWLRVKGHDIVDEQGKTILWRGMGLGGWMLQEGYMYRLPFLGQQYRIREKITDLVGAGKAADFYDQWLQWHTTREDIALMAQWGFNTVRLPMHYNLFTLPVEAEPRPGENTWLEKGFALTDSLLKWCKAYGLYLILDLHAAPGGQGNDLPISDRNPALPSLWESAANRQKTIALWRKLAERFAEEPWIAGYDIINEPNWGFEDPQKDFRGTAERSNIPLRELMIQITQAIREVDKKHIIIIEGNGFGNNYRGVLPSWDDNLVLSFHKYGNFNNEASIKGFLDLRTQYNMPLWLGESGENSNTWFTEAIGLVESKGIGWTWWPWKKMGMNNPLEIKRPPGYDSLLAYWSAKGPKPDSSQAWRILQDWLENLKAANNIRHYDVVDAMFRQVREKTAKPFTHNSINRQSLIQAVDFDLGSQGVAYSDADTARYQYTPGVNTEGNRGFMYRNDGVDIRKDADQYYVFDTHEGEWLQYTLDIQSGGKYAIALKAKSDSSAGAIALWVDGEAVGIPVQIDHHAWKEYQWKDIPLKQGTRRLRIVFVQGGADLATIRLDKQNQ